MADIFISYTNSDRDWAFWLAKEVTALGHRPRVYEWEIDGGQDIYAWMERQHDAADHVLCVVSDDYLKAPFPTLERNAALWQAGKRPGFVLLVAVKPCKLPSLSDHVRRCELFGVPEDAARLRFRDFMTKRTAPEAVAFPGKVFAISNIPVRVPEHFLGRDDALEAIEAALARYDGRVAITALHGLRGIGKTTLAAVYAERHRADFRATWWIRAQTESTMRADLAALGVRLGWVAGAEKEEPAVAAVMERLRHEGEGVLVIYDNAIDAAALRPYLPRGGAAKVLVTSNAHAWRGVAAPVEIRLWPREIGAEYLLARTGRSAERTAAEALSESLGGLPLAHEQAAAYCERLDIALAEYGRRFTAAPARLLDDTRHAPAEYHDGLTVAKAFALAIAEAAKLHPAAEPLILHAALLAPEPIPLFLFAEAREKFGEPLASALIGDGLDEAIAALRAFALLDREMIADERNPAITTDSIRLHRLVREVAAARVDSKAREDMLGTLVRAAAAVYCGDLFDDVKTWPRARRLDSLAIALVDSAISRSTQLETVASLLNRLAEYRNGALGAYGPARLLGERALAIRARVLGPEHPDTAESLNRIGFVIELQGDFNEARLFYERALAINEKIFGPEHQETARNISNLGRLLNELGDLPTARSFQQRAVAIREKVLGPEHVDTAISLGNLGSTLSAQGDFAGARSLQERALAICEKALGSDHHLTAYTMLMLAGCVQYQGDLPRARALFERALTICENVFGPEHPHIAWGLSDLGFALERQGHFAEARRMYDRALAICEKTLGAEHPRTVKNIHSLGRLLQAQGDYAGARRLQERALALREKLNGPEHPWTLKTLQNLGLLLHLQGDLAGSRRLRERALAICEKVLGPEHPDTAFALNGLALCLQAQGDLASARLLHERALVIREKVFGPESPDTAFGLGNIACLLQTQGDLASARPLAERALAIREKMDGPEHRNTALSLNDLGIIIQRQGHLDEARPLIERALAICEKVLGPDHPETAGSLSNLANLLQDKGDLASARPLYERALAIREKGLGPEHIVTNRGRERFATLLLASGEPDRALALAKAALAVHERALGPAHFWTKDSAGTTANALAASGQTVQATALRELYGPSGEGSGPLTDGRA